MERWVGKSRCSVEGGACTQLRGAIWRGAGGSSVWPSPPRREQGAESKSSWADRTEGPQGECRPLRSRAGLCGHLSEPRFSSVKWRHKDPLPTAALGT